MKNLVSMNPTEYEIVFSKISQIKLTSKNSELEFSTEAKLRFKKTSENTTKSSSSKCNQKSRNKPQISKNAVMSPIQSTTFCVLEIKSLTH